MFWKIILGVIGLVVLGVLGLVIKMAVAEVKEEINDMEKADKLGAKK